MPPDPMNARILYWGIEDAGKSTNLKTIHGKLRADHRGDLRQAVTRLDPTVSYEILPIQLGEVGGVPMKIEIVSVPDGPEQAPTRKQLLDEVSGIVLVIDSSPSRADENVALRNELAASLESYGRDLADLPIVVQYNKRDLADDNAIEALHRRLALPASAVFEAIAIEGTGVLQTLTTVSKRVVKNLRNTHTADAAPAVRTESAAEELAAPADDADALAQPAANATEFEPIATESARAERERTTPADASTRLLENAMEAEALASHADLERDAALEIAARASFDETFEQLAEEAKPDNRLSLGAGLRVVSVGTATREDTTAVRVPLVLGDADGATASLALTISIEALFDESEP